MAICPYHQGLKSGFATSGGLGGLQRQRATARGSRLHGCISVKAGTWAGGDAARLGRLGRAREPSMDARMHMGPRQPSAIKLCSNRLTMRFHSRPC